MPPKPRRLKLEALPETCGSCHHAHDVSGQVYLMCHGWPPQPLGDGDGGVSWHRGAPVEPHDPACAFFALKNRA